MTDLTHAEMTASLKALKADLGPKAEISADLNMDGAAAGKSVRLSIMPTGFLGDSHTLYGESWRDVLSKAEAIVAAIVTHQEADAPLSDARFAA